MAQYTFEDEGIRQQAVQRQQKEEAIQEILSKNLGPGQKLVFQKYMTYRYSLPLFATHVMVRNKVEKLYDAGKLEAVLQEFQEYAKKI